MPPRNHHYGIGARVLGFEAPRARPMLVSGPMTPALYESRFYEASTYLNETTTGCICSRRLHPVRLAESATGLRW